MFSRRWKIRPAMSWRRMTPRFAMVLATGRSSFECERCVTCRYRPKCLGRVVEDWPPIDGQDLLPLTHEGIRVSIGIGGGVSACRGVLEEAIQERGFEREALEKAGRSARSIDQGAGCSGVAVSGCARV